MDYGTGSDQSGQTPAAPVMGDTGGVQTPPPAAVVEPTIPVSVPPIGGSDPADIGTPPATTPVVDTGMGAGAPVVTPTAENPEQSGGTGGTTTGM